MGTGGRDRGQRQLLISKLGDSPPPSLLITRKQKMTPPPTTHTQCDGVDHSGALYTLWGYMGIFTERVCPEKTGQYRLGTMMRAQALVRQSSSAWGE